MAYTYDCFDQPTHSATKCDTEKELGRIRHIALVKTSSTLVDPTDQTEWEALEASKEALIIRQVRGESDGGAPVEGEGYGDQPTTVDGYNFTATFFDGRVLQNVDFYNQLVKNIGNYKLWYVTETRVWDTGAIPTVAPIVPIGADPTQRINVSGTFKWQAENPIPTPYAKPGTFFDELPN